MVGLSPVRAILPVSFPSAAGTPAAIYKGASAVPLPRCLLSCLWSLLAGRGPGLKGVPTVLTKGLDCKPVISGEVSSTGRVLQSQRL